MTESMPVLGVNVSPALPPKVPLLLNCIELFGPVGVPLAPGILIITLLPLVVTLTPFPVKFNPVGTLVNKTPLYWISKVVLVVIIIVLGACGTLKAPGWARDIGGLVFLPIGLVIFV